MAKDKTIVEKLSEFSLVNMIVASLKIGDFGKIESFIRRVEKKLSREVSAYEKNIETIKFNSTNRLDVLKDRLEDAQTELSDSKMEIHPDNVGTNEQASDYVDVFLSNITAKRRAVEKLKEDIKYETEKAGDDIDEIKLDIKFNNSLIKDITAKEGK